jgi:hypothetical protein
MEVMGGPGVGDPTTERDLGLSGRIPARLGGWAGSLESPFTDAPEPSLRGIGEGSGERIFVDADDDARTIGARLRQIRSSRKESLR